MKINRVAPFFDSIPSQPDNVRAAARAATRRRNGAMSRGPITPEGKTRSSRNATKHGLFSKMIAPLPDYREVQALQAKIHRELFDEFKPKTFSERALVSALVDDYVQLARARQIWQILSRPAPLSGSDHTRWVNWRTCNAQLKLVRRALAMHAAGENWGMSKAQVGKIAPYVVTLLTSVAECLKADEEPDLEPLDEYEVEERVPQTEMLSAVGPAWRKYMDETLVTSLLTGSRRATRKQRQQLAAILRYAEAILARWLSRNRDVEAKACQQVDASLVALARQPDPQALLHSYVVRIESSIERKVEALEDRMAGSFFRNAK